jgi:hypothetical protein
MIDILCQVSWWFLKNIQKNNYQKKRIVYYSKTYLIMYNFCFLWQMYNEYTWNSHALTTLCLDYIICSYSFRSATFLFVFFLKQTLVSDTFFSFFFSSSFSSVMLPVLWSNSRWERRKKKREMFHMKIFQLIDWVPTDRNIYVYIEINFVIDPVCSNILFIYLIVQKISIFVLSYSKCFFFLSILISFRRIKKKYVKKYTNTLTLLPIILYDDRQASKCWRQER